MKNEVDVYTHYELLIDEDNDPLHDDDRLKQYMSNWDGPLFFRCLDMNVDKRILEIGVGTGRIAKQVLDIGCKEFVGIDISPKTINKAKENLKNYRNIELIVQNALTFVRQSNFDIIYSVLTFLHIEDKELVLKNIFTSLKSGGHLVLSISKDDYWLEYESRKIRLFPQNKEYYLKLLNDVGFKIEVDEETESEFAVIIKARKV